MKSLKFSKLNIILLLLLITSLYFNFKPQIPLFAYSVNYHFADRLGHEIKFVYDSEKFPEEVLYTMNILEHLSVTDEHVDLDFENPDLILKRHVTLLGYTDGIYNFHFQGDIAYIWTGNDYDEHEIIDIYKTDHYDTERLKELTKYDPNYTAMYPS